MPRVIPGVLVALVLAACGGSAATTTTSSTSSTTSTTSTTVASTTTSLVTTTSESTTTTEPLGPPSPVNGLPVDRPELLDRRVLAVKVDNHPNARPQSGLQEADAVIELKVEGGFTRFIALFHQSDSAYLGPIRSGRPTDPTLIAPLGATLVISGASYWVLAKFRQRGLPVLGNTPPAMFRISSRRAPYNLYGDTVKMRERADRAGFSDDPPDAPYFEFGPLPAGGEPATDLLFDWAPGNRVTWSWNGEGYERVVGGETQEWLGADGRRGPLVFDTLVVLFGQPYTARPDRPSDGKPVPAIDVVGSGRALVASGGTVVEGTWRRSRDTEPFRLTTADGTPLLVPPGKIWISVFPLNRRVSW